MKSFFRYIYSNKDKNKNNNNFSSSSSASTNYINSNNINNNQNSNSNNNNNNNNNNNKTKQNKNNNNYINYLNNSNNNSNSNNNKNSFNSNNINIYSNINNIKWNTIINIERIDICNSNTIFLVTFLEDQNNNQYNKILLKTSITIAQELYASILESTLNYPVNNCRLIEFSQDEFIEMSTSLLSFTNNNNNNNINNNNNLYQLIKKEIEKSFFIIMEIKDNGKRFNQLNHKKYFSGKNSKKKLLQLGQVIAFEIFCNNFCLSPISWDENTFFSNLIFYDTPNSDGWYFSIIHSNVNKYKDSLFSRGYRDQINRLKLLLFSVFQNPNSESEEIQRMREFLKVYLHIHLPSSSVLHIQNGIVIGVKSLVSNISFTMLESTKSKIKNLVHIDTQNNLWRNGINSIGLNPFLLDVLNDFLSDLSNFREKRIKINLIL